MLIRSSIAGSALALAVATAVVLSAPAALAASASIPDGGTSAVSDDDAPSDDAVLVTDPVADEEEEPAASEVVTVRRPTSGRWARVAPARAVKARLTAFDRTAVSWRAGAGGAAVQRFAVELRSGRTVLQASLPSGARSVPFWSLPSGRRFTVTVTAVAADGSRAASKAVVLRTPSASAAVRSTLQDAARAKAAARHAKAGSLL